MNVHADYITTYSKDRYYKTKGVDGFSLEDYENIKKKLMSLFEDSLFSRTLH
jgi:hypothetical protein